MKKVNIWDVNMAFSEYGGDVEQIGNNRRAQTVLDRSTDVQRNSLPGTLSYTAFMALYFSLGRDAMIGYDFEANRTGSRCRNFCQYFLSGLKRFFCPCCWTRQENMHLRDQIELGRKRGKSYFKKKYKY